MKFSDMLGKEHHFTHAAVPAFNRLSSACKRINDRWPDVIPTPSGEPDSILREISDRIRNNDWEKATVAFVIRAGRLAFDEKYRNEPNFSHLLEFYYQETKASTRPSFLSGIMSIYLTSYEPHTNHSQILAKTLKGSQHRLAGRWNTLLRNFPQLFDAHFAPKHLGHLMSNMPDLWSGLIEMGFQNPHAVGFLSHAHLAFVDLVKTRLRSEREVRRMLRWIAPSGKLPRRTGAKEAIEALLTPWKSRQPSDEIRDDLISVLPASYKGFYTPSGIWRLVDNECREVLIRWLTGASINFFLDIVSYVERSHMWQPRREFWLNLYEEGKIDAAWVAFSPTAARRAKDLEREQGTSSHLEYGTQIAGGSRRDTSLLILKIGRTIVVEGSHDYKVQIFKESNRQVPRLFEKRYDCEQIRGIPGASHEQIAHTTYWKDRVRELLNYWA